VQISNYKFWKKSAHYTRVNTVLILQEGKKGKSEIDIDFQFLIWNEN